MNSHIYAPAASPPGKESLNRKRRGFEGRSGRSDKECNRLPPAAKRATIPQLPFRGIGTTSTALFHLPLDAFM